MKHMIVPSAIIAGLTIVIAESCAFFKLSSLLGGYCPFGLLSMMAPALGTSSAGLFGLFIVFAKRFFWHKGTLLSWFLHAAHVPTIGAIVYWATSHYSIRLLFPLLCMGLFWSHPIGAQAWPYALYWLIPVVLYCLPNNKNSVYTALGSTFIAHATGSIIWLYTVPMTSQQWLALIPVVALERLISTIVMVATYSFISGCTAHIHTGIIYLRRRLTRSLLAQETA